MGPRKFQALRTTSSQGLTSAGLVGAQGARDAAATDAHLETADKCRCDRSRSPRCGELRKQWVQPAERRRRRGERRDGVILERRRVRRQHHFELWRQLRIERRRVLRATAVLSSSGGSSGSSGSPSGLRDERRARLRRRTPPAPTAPPATVRPRNPALQNPAPRPTPRAATVRGRETPRLSVRPDPAGRDSANERRRNASPACDGGPSGTVPRRLSLATNPLPRARTHDGLLRHRARFPRARRAPTMAGSGLQCLRGAASAAGLARACSVDSNCLSNACDANSLKCVAIQCADHRQDGNETDVDCGGNSCPACATSKKCLGDNDCTSNACDATSTTCVANQCADHRLDWQRERRRLRPPGPVRAALRATRATGMSIARPVTPAARPCRTSAC